MGRRLKAAAAQVRPSRLRRQSPQTDGSLRRADRLRSLELALADTAGFILLLSAILALSAAWFPPPLHGAAAWAPAALFLGVAAGLWSCGQYDRKAAITDEDGSLLRWSAYAFLVHLMLNLTVFEAWGAYVMLLVWVGLPLVAPVMRRLALALFVGTDAWSVQAVLVGSSRATEVARSLLLARPMAGLRPVVCSGGWDALRKPAADPAMILARSNAALVVVAAEGEADDEAVLRSLAQAKVPALQVIMVDGTAGVPHWTPRSRERMSRAGLLTKSAFDFLATLVLCAIVAPVLVALSVIVKLDGGPVFFRHERVGYRGRTFHCLKFRTMVMDADAALQELLARDPDARRQWTETRKLRHDPRVTPIGRFLRATSLDELPQLFNVLRGEMSLVGPRPIVPAELPRYGADVAYYLAAVPGLTGLWQVSGRSDTSYQLRVKLDIDYVRTGTFWTDVAILFKTVPAVLLKRGAA